jgi:hypothetical protein
MMDAMPEVFIHFDKKSRVLTTMLSKMDDLELFNQSDGMRPFLLCDGHGIIFEETFLEYTLESSKFWTHCIGVPCGTSIWKIGDSTEKNEMFKIESKNTKACTIIYNIRAGLPGMLKKSNINTHNRGIAARERGLSTTSYLIILNCKKQRRKCSQ